MSMQCLLQIRTDVATGTRLSRKVEELRAKVQKDLTKHNKVDCLKVRSPKDSEEFNAKGAGLRDLLKKLTVSNLVRVLLEAPLPPDEQLIQILRTEGKVRGRPTKA